MSRELENDSAGVAGLSAGCLMATLGGVFGLLALGLAADAEGAAPIVGGLSLLLLVVGLAILSLGGLAVQETFVLSAAGVELERSWLKRRSRASVASRDRIRCLALDASERRPRRWRLVLVRQDGTLHQLRGHGVGTDEEQNWAERCQLGQELAAVLGVPLLLPEPHERDRQLEVLPGNPATIHYPELPRAIVTELKAVVGALLALVGGGLLVAWLHGRGWF